MRLQMWYNCFERKTPIKISLAISYLNGLPRLRNFMALRTSVPAGKSNCVDADRAENFGGGDQLEPVVVGTVSGNVRMTAARGRLLRIRASAMGVKILMITFTDLHSLKNALM